MGEVFISSSGDTAAVAEKLRRELAARDFEVFLHCEHFLEGNWAPMIRERIARAESFVVVVNANREHSDFERREWFEILNETSDLKKGKKLIPVVIGHGVPPAFVWNWQQVRLSDPSDVKRWRKVVDKIADALRSTAKPKLVPMPKPYIREYERRQEAIAATARKLKSLGVWD
jgi:hypothetical protein